MAADRQSTSQDYLYPVDAIRFLSALSVMAFHLAFYSWANPRSSTGHMMDGAAAFPGATAWSWFGWVGVEVFFVVSGLVIANSAGGATPVGFLRGRMLRLLPAAWICATLSLAAWLLIDQAPVGAWLRPYLNALTLWPLGPWVDGVYWSLAVECVFYALILLTLLAHGFRAISLVAVTLTVCSGVYLALHLQQPWAADGAWRWVDRHADVLLLRHGAFFAVGVWLWLASRRRLSAFDIGGLALASLVGVVEILLRADELMDGEAAAAAGQPLFLPAAIWLAAVAAIAVFARWPGRFTPASPRVRSELKRLGQATYPLYLIHNVFGVGMLRFLVSHGVPATLALAGGAMSALLASLLIARSFEPAVRERLRRVIDGALAASAAWRGGDRGRAVAP